MRQRLPFLARCPVCGSEARSPVIQFPELAFARCATCGLIYKSETQAQLGVGYEEDYFRFNRAKYLERWEHRVSKCGRQIVDCLQVAPRARVLCDVGCSAGYVLEAARRLGLQPVGVDLSRFAVALCRERGFRAEQGALEALPLDDESVDVITLKHTLEHSRDPMRALLELKRVLRPDGAALIVVPDAAYWKLTWLPRVGRAFRPDRRGWQHHVYFREANLVDACRRAGLEVVRLGKAVRRHGPGSGGVSEWLRFGWLALYSWLGRATRLRHEMQLIAVKPR